MRITMKAARVNKGLTQEDAARELNVTKKTISLWESGKVCPKIDKIEPICSLYGVSYEDISWQA